MTGALIYLKSGLLLVASSISKVAAEQIIAV